MAKMNFKMSGSRAWLDSRSEHDSGMVSAGKLARNLDALQHPPASDADALQSIAFSKLVELRRRDRGLDMEALAKLADVDLAEVVEIEERGITPEPRTVHRLAEVLELPLQGLMRLSGLADSRSERIGQSAVRFAASSKPMSKLSGEERKRLEEFVRQLAEE